MPDMSDNEVLSLLGKIDAEQRTMESLWAQFSVARKRVGEVIKRFQVVSVELPGLEMRVVAARAELAELEPAYEKRKQELVVAEGEARKALAAESEPLQRTINEQRVALLAINRRIEEADRRATQHKKELDAHILMKRTELDNLTTALAELKRKHALA